MSASSIVRACRQILGLHIRTYQPLVCFSSYECLGRAWRVMACALRARSRCRISCSCLSYILASVFLNVGMNLCMTGLFLV
jgi:hypothetical protein